MHMGLRGVQQNLAPRGIICKPVEPYRDGRTRYGVWPQGKRILAKYTDDVEHAYILGLKGFDNVPH